MSFKTASSLNYRSVIETKITVPRDSVIINNTEIIGNEPSVCAVNDHKKQKDYTFDLGGWENDFQER